MHLGGRIRARPCILQPHQPLPISTYTPIRLPCNSLPDDKRLGMRGAPSLGAMWATDIQESVSNVRVNGRTVPALGFGTFELTGSTCERAVEAALETGYRHIDTARMYDNENDVGSALAESGIPRSELFITSKVWFDALDAESVRSSVQDALTDLQLDYLDLVLAHWPSPTVPIEETIAAFADLRREKLIRNYGVSNFPVRLLQRALSCGPVACNQVEYHPFLDQSKLHAFARNNDLLLTAYSPLAQGEVHETKALADIARKHGKTNEQIALRWLVSQENVAAIPRSSNPDHIRRNFNIFDFELEPEDYAEIARLPKNRRLVDPDFAPNWDR